MKIFINTEFTGLIKNTDLISLGMHAENGCEFYGINQGYDRDKCDTWVRSEVIRHLHDPIVVHGPVCIAQSPFHMSINVKKWLEPFEKVEIWGDCLAWDWVLFCDLFGGALFIPKNIYYIPFDLSTLFLTKGIDPDISRADFSGLNYNRHHALLDARVTYVCWKKLQD